MQSILATGLLKQKNHGARTRLRKFHITRLTEEHLPAVMNLQKIIIRNLASPDLLQTFSSDFMKEHMGSKGIVLGVFVENDLIAFRNIYYPDPHDKEWNLGFDIGLTKSQRSNVVNLQMVCVHPDFRGNSLAMKMNRIALKLLREKGTHRYVCATVSPKNVWNIPVLLENGFHITKLKQKYGGKLRYVVYQDLQSPRSSDTHRSIKVSLTDLDTQKKLLKRGFFGASLNRKKNTALKNPAEGFDLIFRSPVKDTRACVH